jgi:hypothetical protein
MLHVVKMVPCRRREFSDLTGCETSSIYGYRLVCSCGYRSKVRRKVSELVPLKSAHFG